MNEGRVANILTVKQYVRDEDKKMVRERTAFSCKEGWPASINVTYQQYARDEGKKVGGNKIEPKRMAEGGRHYWSNTETICERWYPCPDGTIQ